MDTLAASGKSVDDVINMINKKKTGALPSCYSLTMHLLCYGFLKQIAFYSLFHFIPLPDVPMASKSFLHKNRIKSCCADYITNAFPDSKHLEAAFIFKRFIHYKQNTKPCGRYICHIINI